jgi:heme/copper-type cytochrome/quinol oxidase subunit 2
LFFCIVQYELVVYLHSTTIIFKIKTAFRLFTLVKAVAAAATLHLLPRVKRLELEQTPGMFHLVVLEWVVHVVVGGWSLLEVYRFRRRRRRKEKPKRSRKGKKGKTKSEKSKMVRK